MARRSALKSTATPRKKTIPNTGCQTVAGSCTPVKLHPGVEVAECKERFAQ
jgi:hypothetical protein